MLNTSSENLKMNGRPLILASASPRRKEILEAHGHSPIVIPADVDETLREGADECPEKTTISLAEQKAEAVFMSLDAEEYPQGCTVLGVDTIVYKDRIIGKPVDEADALDILRSLRNGDHDVISGVCIIHAIQVHLILECGLYKKNLSRTRTTLFSDVTTVKFGDYSDVEILNYVRAAQPYDKSGSYAIQSDWGRHVLEVTGDIENVIGLPYQKLSTHL